MLYSAKCCFFCPPFVFQTQNLFKKPPLFILEKSRVFRVGSGDIPRDTAVFNVGGHNDGTHICRLWGQLCGILTLKMFTKLTEGTSQYYNIKWIIPKKTGFNLYQWQHCACITYSVKTWFLKISLYIKENELLSKKMNSLDEKNSWEIWANFWNSTRKQNKLYVNTVNCCEIGLFYSRPYIFCDKVKKGSTKTMNKSDLEKNSG